MESATPTPLYPNMVWWDEVQYDMSTFRIHDRIWKPPTLQNRFHIVFYQMGSQQTPGFGKVWILHYIGKVWACGFEILAWLIVCSAFEVVPRVVSEIQPAESFNAIANENPSQKCLCNFNAAFFYRDWQKSKWHSSSLHNCQLLFNFKNWYFATCLHANGIVWVRFLAALAALYLTLVSQWVGEWLTATFEFRHKEWLLTLETLQTFDQHDVQTKEKR